MIIAPNLTQEICMMEAELCSAFSDATRLLILYELADHAQTVTDLTVSLAISQPTASRHLKVLRDRGLVSTERRGTTIHYQLSDHRLIDALDILRSVMRDRVIRNANLMMEIIN